MIFVNQLTNVNYDYNNSNIQAQIQDINEYNEYNEQIIRDFFTQR